MVSRDFIFWEVDTQADFMLPGGKLYVPAAEKLLPNIRRLTNAARQGKVFLVSHGCFHRPDDPEFKIFRPHCVKGTAGAEFVPEALTDKVVRIPNEADAKLAEMTAQLEGIQANLAGLRREVEAMEKKKQELQHEKELTQLRLERAEKLIVLLADEGKYSDGVHGRQCDSGAGGRDHQYG